MASTSDQGLVAPARSPSAGPLAAGGDVRGGVHGGRADRLVLVSIALTLALLVPGLIIKFGFVPQGSDIGSRGLRALALALYDIRFGHGLRFWLGVGGTGIMAMMLLYPLRKALGGGRFLGRVAGWYQLHIVAGLLAPAMVLYHTGFGFGGTNANVALVAMLVVVVSGLAGYFVYGRVSRQFYVTRAQAQRHREAILAVLDRIGARRVHIAALIETLDAFEADLMRARAGLFARVRARFRVETFRRTLWQQMCRGVEDGVQAGGLSARDVAVAMEDVTENARGYFRLARTASNGAVVEQLWARWRLFHLPLFLILLAAIVLHVWAVWGVDDGAVVRAAVPSPVQQATVSDVAPAPSTAPVSAPLSAPVPEPKLVAPPTQVDRPRSDQTQVAGAVETRRSTSIDDLLAGRAASQQRVPSPVPVPVPDPGTGTERPVPRPVPAARPVRAADGVRPPEPPVAPALAVVPVAPVPPDAPVAVTPPAPTPPVPVPTVAAPPVVAPTVMAPTVMAPPVATPRGPAKPPIKEVYAELQKRQVAPPAGLGGGGLPGSLKEQIALFKSKKAAGTFFHAAEETGFELLGKHLKADCASCHTAPLTGKRSESPRACIDCHKKDDVHKGRRPDCANCHVPNRWTQILRRK